MKSKLIGGLLILGSAALFLACSSGPPLVAPEPADPALKGAKTLFQERCSKCHSTDKPLGKKKTSEEWTKTVNRMQAKSGSGITGAEAADIAKYLSAVAGSK